MSQPGPDTQQKIKRWMLFLEKHRERVEWLVRELHIDPISADSIIFDFEQSERLAELDRKVEKVEQNTQNLPVFIEKIWKAVGKFVGDLNKDLKR